MCEVIDVVCAGGVIAIDGHKGSVHVKYHIDTGRVEDACALVVIRVGIDVVHADGIDLIKCQHNCQRVGMGPHTPSICSNAASRTQAAPSLRTSELELGSKADDPPGW